MLDGDGGNWTTWRPSIGVGVGLRDGQGVENGLAMLIFGITGLERIWRWQAVSADCVAMVALASCAWCVLGERMRLACRTGVAAWRARLVEGTKGISPRALRVPTPSSNLRLGKAEEPDEREEGDDPRDLSVSIAKEMKARCSLASDAGRGVCGWLGRPIAR
jgi:hypothetical protein